MQDPVHDHRSLFHLKIKAIFLRPESIQDPPIPVDFSKSLAVEIVQILLAHLELFKQFELLKGAELGKLRGADFIEDDLKHALKLSPHKRPEKRKEMPISFHRALRLTHPKTVASVRAPS